MNDCLVKQQEILANAK